MKYDLVISSQAENDLRSIFEYLAFELLAEENAVKQLNRLEKGIHGLKEFPDRHRRYRNAPWYFRGLRVMTIDHYNVFYIPDRDRAIVTVIRVMYGGRDIDAQLKRDTFCELSNGS